ncbi:MAG: hypothetical protein JWN32_349 [Solirubrobacterales bacterium]|nr:hypothetical protein [Solirubrobacterales bacterium]
MGQIWLARAKYPDREPGFNLLLVSSWTDPAQNDSCITWARETFDTLAPYMADRAYTNYLSADDHDRVGKTIDTSEARERALGELEEAIEELVGS